MADDLKPMKSDLYERDYLAWTEVQAAALRARGAGRNAFDYDHLAEEIEDLGKSEMRACESQVENIIEHLLKIEFVGPIETLPHWRGEISNFRRELNRRKTTTIVNRLQPELGEIFAHVVKTLATRNLIADQGVVTARRDGYDWQQIIDADWYPEPQY